MQIITSVKNNLALNIHVTFLFFFFFFFVQYIIDIVTDTRHQNVATLCKHAYANKSFCTPLAFPLYGKIDKHCVMLSKRFFFLIILILNARAGSILDHKNTLYDIRSARKTYV